MGNCTGNYILHEVDNVSPKLHQNLNYLIGNHRAAGSGHKNVLMNNLNDYAAQQDDTDGTVTTSMHFPRDIISLCLSFLGAGHYRYLGGVSLEFLRAYRQLYGTSDSAIYTTNINIFHFPISCVRLFI